MRYIILVSFILIISEAFAITHEADGDTCRIEIDLKNIRDDRADVRVYPGKIDSDSTVYNMPKIVPGTYSISDFGRFVNNLKAYDPLGDTLPVTRLDENRWMIANATKLDHISYRVDDTFDGPPNGIFEPGGTEISAGKSAMVNLFGFAGYFDAQKDQPFRLEIIRPEKFYGETTLPRISSADTIDYFKAKNYFELHDCPILYCEPDTSSMYIGHTRIGVSVYSPSGQITSKEVLDEVRDLFEATAKYLGGELPVDRYSILLYLTGMNTMSGGMGALEHNTSTTFVLPDAPIAALGQTIRDVTAHEFMHIVTPLSIHSEQIGDFNFMDPEMSQNLWFYEGSTEYAAHLIQVREGLISLDEFLDVIRNKIISASGYDASVPFTELSKHVLDKYKDQYGNVYEQGALISMALDLKLRNLSDGEYGLRDLKKGLSKTYGPDSSFVDTALFTIMGRVSGYPEISAFLDKYVAHSNPLPLTELLDYAGIMFRDSVTSPSIDSGNLTLGYNPKTENLVVVRIKENNAFAKDLGIKEKDQLLTWNGTDVDLENMRDVMADFKAGVKPGDKVVVEVLREKKGREKRLKLKARARETVKTRYNVLEPEANSTTEQLKIRKSWINQ